MSPKIPTTIRPKSPAGSEIISSFGMGAMVVKKQRVIKERPTLKERKYPCNVCGKRFTRPSSLACHKFTHTGERPHGCPFPNCNKRFSVRSNLRRHLKVHDKQASKLAVKMEEQSSSTAQSSSPIVHDSPQLSIESYMFCTPPSLQIDNNSYTAVIRQPSLPLVDAMLDQQQRKRMASESSTGSCTTSPTILLTPSPPLTGLVFPTTTTTTTTTTSLLQPMTCPNTSAGSLWPVAINPPDQIYPNPDQYFAATTTTTPSSSSSSSSPSSVLPTNAVAGNCFNSQLILPPKLQLPFYSADHVYTISNNTRNLDFIIDPLITPSSSATATPQLLAPFTPIFPLGNSHFQK
ncbi:hypothetical protein GGI12_002920 [Dipsacomyces acuminosporus]|nr:hypothetical protein GGI12_002920 [Dipsacomyces acuminosporus]